MGIVGGIFALIGILLVGVLAVGVYFLPAIIAGSRKHRNMAGVSLLNLFLGWTLIGWVGALVWAVLEGERRDQIPPGAGVYDKESARGVGDRAP